MNILQNIQTIANNPIVKSLENNSIVKSLENDAYSAYEKVLASGKIPLIIINGIKIKLNTLRSDIKPSDQQYIGIGTPLTTIDLRSQLLPVRNQGNVCACVSFSASCMKEFQDKTNSYLSPAFIYHSRSNYPNDCMTIKNALEILTLSGVCYDSTYEYTNIKEVGAIPQNAIIEANNFKIKSYLQIKDINSLKSALQNNGPCPIAFPVYNYTNQLWIQNPGDIFMGGHCMTVVGYDETSFIIRNSWGRDWGNKGYTNFPFDQWGAQWEVWTGVNYPQTPSSVPQKIILAQVPTEEKVNVKPTKNSSSGTQKSSSGLSKRTIIIITCIVCFLLIAALIVLKFKKKASINE